MKTNANAVVAAVLCAAVSLGAVGCGKKSSGGTDDDPGTVLGNAIVLSMAKDQYAKAKAAYDSGGDAAGECIMDTAELRKDKSAEAQKLANDIDTLCDVNVPAKDLEARLKTELADVTTERAGKGEMLAADQVVLQGTCDDIDAALKDMAAKNLATQPGATTLKTQRDAACTPDNLTGGAQKQARRK